MGFAQDLLDEIGAEERAEKYERIVIKKNEEEQVHEELYNALQEELAGKHGAQDLIDSV